MESDRRTAFWMPDEEKPARKGSRWHGKKKQHGRQGRSQRLKKNAAKDRATRKDAKRDSFMGAMMGAVSAR